MSRRQLLWVAAIVLVASGLSALVAYQHGIRRARLGAAAASAAGEAEGPCVNFDAAAQSVGKSACVAGRVLRVFTSRAGNTFLDFCADYRTCPFTAVIFSEDRARFGDLGQLQGRQVEIRGLVSYYNQRAEIIIHDPQQIRPVP